MKKGKLISISFVGVLETPLQKIPSLSRDFGKELFNNDAGTDMFFGPDGLVIMIPNKIVPMAIVNPLKITIKAISALEMVRIASALYEKLNQEGTQVASSAFGINYELQYLELGKESEAWLWERFIKDSVNTRFSDKLCNKLSFRMNVNDLQALNVAIEPRMGVHDGLFVSVNHHHNIGIQNIPSRSELESYIKKSQDIVDVMLNEFVGENQQ